MTSFIVILLIIQRHDEVHAAKTPLSVREIQIGRLRICAVEARTRNIGALWVY
jgi:hypothetical protein